jgi:hypothetical protein
VNTEQSFDHYLDKCRAIFIKKNSDYGPSWRVLRPASLTDQILIKISRVRSIDEKGHQKVDDPLEGEFSGLINYSIMALIQLLKGAELEDNMSLEELKKEYEEQVSATLQLMLNKNHDYGEVWRMMRPSSIIDIILMKVHRIKRIEENAGNTIISEGIDANYQDIINYCVFALILLEKTN